MANKRIFKFTLNDVSAATGRGIDSVRDDSSRGKFDPEDLLSLARYVVGHVLIRALKWSKK